MTNLKQIVELGKRASADARTIATAYCDLPKFGPTEKELASQAQAHIDAQYQLAAANSADIMAQQLLDIEKLCDASLAMSIDVSKVLQILRRVE